MEDKVSAYNLLDILESSVLKAKQDIDRQYMENIKSHFNEDGTPKQILVSTSSKNLTIPTMCLTNLRPLNVKSVAINFNCSIEDIKNNDLILNLAKNETKNSIHISIVMNSEEPPETIMRVNDMLILEYIS